MTDLLTILIGVFAVPILLLLIIGTALGRIPRFARFSLPGVSRSSALRGENVGVVLAVVAIALSLLDIAEARPDLGERGAVGVAVLALGGVVALRFGGGLARIAVALAGIAVSVWAIWVVHGAGAVLVVGAIVLLLLWALGAAGSWR